MKPLFTFVIVCILLMPAMGQADFESNVFDLVNDERAAQGLEPLNFNACLADAARAHSEDMGVNGYFSHTSQDGRSPGDRIAAAGYIWWAYGENIAAGYPTPQAVMEGWMNSDGHRANILDPDLCDIGVGYAYVSASTYGHYWTQNFGCKSADDPCPVTDTYTIYATAGTGGRIEPSGEIRVQQGNRLVLTMTPDTGYSLDQVIVDDQAQAVETTYTFADITRNHTIDVFFTVGQSPPDTGADPAPPVQEGETITAAGNSSGSGGCFILFLGTGSSPSPATGSPARQGMLR